ncbi:protein Skeletor, isoforms B/C isoform X2 [Chelonus insularis]|uniref:protein Skeletor, isoforms B/C isoform X2 n=1 Tax=Chelonus insularis TaxID=460826 RepID=UPI00158DCDF7|nr:protein Skeletor, isoforms B/C isoform X2 [Chelonus insularis]
MNSGSSLFSLSSWSSSSTSCGNAAFKFHSLGLLTFFILFFTQNVAGEYYGKFIGNLSELHHGVSGQVYAVDSRTLFIKDFTYDGEGPAGYFYAGNSRAPIINGFKLRDEKGSAGPLKAYNKKSISIALPEGKSLNNIRWFSVYCDDYSVNFGDVRIPRGFDFPKPQKLAALNGIHRVKSDPIVVIDAQTLLVPSFSYDGEAPDVKFWVGTGSAPSPQGIRVPDENGKTAPLPSYNNKTIVLTLPGDLTIFQIDYFSVYCEAFAVSFAFIHIPKGLNVPPSLNMLGISPQNVEHGQGQIGPNNSEQSYSTYSETSSSLLTQSHQTQRPTTYRPHLDRHVPVQTIRSIDHRLPHKNFDSLNSQRVTPTSFRHSQNDDSLPPSSYARVLSYQGNQRHDSYIRY